MDRRTRLFTILGCLFGAIGLYILAALSLVAPFVETLSIPFMWPGRSAAGLFAGSDGSTLEVIALTLGNAVLYALIGYGIARVTARPAEPAERFRKPVVR